MNNIFIEEKKGYMLKRVAPDMGPDTQWYYKPAHRIDQEWSVKSAGIRQRHIDQAQSMNLYITNEFTFKKVLELYLLAHKSGVKTVYYIRSKSLEIEECESCSS
jgi:ribonucleoside-diphosphate reductase alpha chain